MAAATQAIRRLKRDLDHLDKNPNPQLLVRPSSKSLLEWHFVLHRLPADSPYGAGCYHGRLTFPETYPMAPPALVMLTPNGRLQTNQRLCLSMTDFHPESWNPAWTVESLLVGVISFLVDDKDTRGIGSLTESPEVRRSLALKSWDFNLKDPEFPELFPEVLEAPATSGFEPRVEQAWQDCPQSTEQTALPVAASGNEAQQAASAVTDAKLDSDCVEIMLRDVSVSDEDAAAPALISLHGAAEAPAPISLPRSEECVEHPHGPQAEDSGGDLETHQQGTPPDGDTRHEGDADMSSELSVQECWICREDTAREPLIQPCNCRGSMSGVHASCVEAWIAHHRANGHEHEMPRCSVCVIEYLGEEKRPGLPEFLQYLCFDFLQQVARSLILILLIICYWLAAQPKVDLSTRAIFLTFSGGCFLCKAVVLTVSCGRPPPAGIERFFYTANFVELVALGAELLLVVVISSFWCASGHLDFYYVVPLIILLILPIATLVLGGYSPLTIFCFILPVIASPLLVMVEMLQMLQLVWRSPKRLIDPTDGLLHMVFPAATIVLSWSSRSTMPLVVLWCFHGVMMLFCIIDKYSCRKLDFKEGQAWWIFSKIAVFATYIVNLMNNFKSEHSPGGLFAASLMWLALCQSLSVVVNMRSCIRAFHVWQQQNGRFSLSPRSSHGHEPFCQVGGQVIGRGQQLDELAPAQPV